jgi:hypothetical protein
MNKKTKKWNHYCLAETKTISNVLLNDFLEVYRNELNPTSVDRMTWQGSLTEGEGLVRLTSSY